MALFLGIDLGTTGVKALVINEVGRVLAKHIETYPLYHPYPGWAEQYTEDWWKAVVRAIQAILSQLGNQAQEVISLAFSGQMHGSVFLNKAGQVIRPPILWCDTRTTPQCQEITERVGKDRLYTLVSNPALEGFTAPKVLWLREHEPQHYKQLHTLLLPKDYIVYRLTGRKVTEVSDAAGTLLFDVRHRRWSTELVELLELPPEILPEVLESIDVVGRLTPEAARVTGLSPHVQVVAGGADNTCSAVGNGIIEEGLVLSSIGSSGVIFAHTDTPRQDPFGRLHTFNHSIPNKWYLMGVMLAAGLSLKWFKEAFGEEEVRVARLAGLEAYELLDQEAAQVPPGSEGLLFLPYLYGERTPHQDAQARGVFLGISSCHGKPHFVRAILEGVAFGLRDSLELIEELGISIREVRLTGGGARSPLWRQIQADVFGRPVALPAIDEGPAFGAALIAGVGSGFYKSIMDAVQCAVQIRDHLEPRPEGVEAYQALYPIFKGLYGSLRSTFAELYAFTQVFRRAMKDN
jgi:xylulokinase